MSTKSTGPYATAYLHPQVPVFNGAAFVQVAETEEETVAFLIEQIDPETRASLVESGSIPAHHAWSTSYILTPDGFDFHAPRTSDDWDLLLRELSDTPNGAFDNLNSAGSSITAVRERED